VVQKPLELEQYVTETLLSEDPKAKIIRDALQEAEMLKGAPAALWNYIEDSYVDIVNASPEKQSELAGILVMNIALMFVGAGELKLIKGIDDMMSKTWKILAEAEVKDTKPSIGGLDRSKVDPIPETKGTGHPNGTPNPTHNANGDRIDNVDVPKVKEPSSVSEFMRQEDLAFDMYGAFKKLKNDTSDIARNTGWKESDIQQIKDHLLFEKHKFDSGEIKSFDPNYQQALAWERLMKGNYNKNDILLLNHELFESNYMKKYGATYEKAHAEAQKQYNWSDSVYE